MVMKMLEAGGVEPLTDGIRVADEDNPGGYYELEQVKHAEKDSAWVNSAVGKAVKVISQLLETLPRNMKYKVVFLERSMQEILASQRAMLIRRGHRGVEVADEEMAALFNHHLSELRAWLEIQDQMDVLYTDYAAVVEDPLGESRRISDFLAVPLDEQKMAEVVDENLYRQRGS